MLIKRSRSNIIFLVIVFIYFNTSVLAQNKPHVLTKIFFEFGFKNCDVKITTKNRVLFNEKLNRDSGVTGATKIVPIKGVKLCSIILNICGKIKKIDIKKGMFYRINMIDNNIEIEEVDMEPLYVFLTFSASGRSDNEKISGLRSGTPTTVEDSTMLSPF
ncbi:MAG: hypothetical protein ABIR78_02420 [Ferruginibacter sp.]